MMRVASSGVMHERLGAVLVRSYHPPKPKLSTKKNVKKRFKLTPNGKIKYWPSQLGGRPRFVTPKGNMKHVAFLLAPSQGNRKKWTQPLQKKRDFVEVLLAARKRFEEVQGRSLSEDELQQLVEAVKNCRFEGNHVLPGLGQQPLSFPKELSSSKD